MQSAKQLRLTVFVALGVFIGGMLALNLYTLNQSRQQAIQTELEDAAAQARSFEHFVTQNLNVVEMLTSSAAVDLSRANNLSEIEAAFPAILRDTPLLRSISLLDEEGRILTSSNPANVGRSVNTDRYWPPVGGTSHMLRIGQPWSGRDFADGAPSTPIAPIEVGKIYFIPAIHTVQINQQTERVLVAINADYLLNNLLQSHAPDDGSTSISLYDGTLLLDSDPAALIGTQEPNLLATLGLSMHESGSEERDVGANLHALTAFRASSSYPLVIQTHRHRDSALRAWTSHALRLTSVIIGALLLISVIAYAFYRRQRNHMAQTAEAARRLQLNARVFHASTDGILICDAQANIISVNRAFTYITGFKADEVLGRNPRLLASGQHNVNFYVAMWRDLLSNGLWQGDVINRRADGTHFHAQAAITLSRDRNGQIEHYIGTLKDVSQLHHAQIELRHSEERFRSLTALSSDGYWEQNARLELTHLSSNLVQKTGVSTAELLGRGIQDLPVLNLTKEQRQAHRALLDAHRPFHHLEVQLPDHQNRANWITLSGTPMFDQAGQFAGYRGVGSDITERKLAQFELERALGRLQKIASRVPGVIYEFRVRPDGSSSFPYNSDPVKTLQISGITADALLQDASPLLARIHPDDYATTASTLQVSARKLTAWRHEYRLRDPDASVRWVLCNAIPEREEDGSTLWYGYVSDITEQKLAETQITESRNLLMTVIDTSPLRIFWKDVDSRYLGCNKAFAEDCGFDSPKALIGLDDDAVHSAELAEHCRREDRAILSTGLPKLFFNQSHTRPDGHLVWRRTSRAPLKGQQGQIIGVLGIYEDITEAKQTQDQLHLAASVFAHSREGIMITATDGTIIDINEAFTNITGYSRSEMVGKNPRILNSGRQPKEFYSAMWRDLTQKGHWYGEVWNRRKSGDVYAEMQTISTVLDAEGRATHFVSLFSDITANKEHERQLEHIAHYDALTGLPNRVLLADRLQQGMSQSVRRDRLLAVAFLDLDAFKSVNDTHGHEVGDDLLIALATRMRQTLREGDTLARIGGDEFVAVLGDLPDVSASLPMLTRLLTAAAQPVEVGDLTLQLSASLGVTFFPQTDAVDADQLMRQADQAMYQAKLAGKNRYHVFDAEQDRSVRGHHESVERIRQALASQEFVLYFQPKVNMRSGQIIGAEALIRWQHPEKGLLSPAVFLPIIEDHPLAIEIGEWVINAALMQMTRWREAHGLALPVSVNIGARQLQHANFSERLREILAAHPSINPGDLELEVLETSALEDLTGVSLVIDACRSLGVNFALDDFGTGYSSLTYLKRLPVSMLKIDQSFVRDMLDDPDDLAILQGVIGLASAFRRSVIAEGVETIAHGATLLQLGCELAQGYGIARPMPAQALPAWCAAWQPDPSWSGQPVLGRDTLPLLFAKAELRAWVMALEAFLKNERQFPPPLDVHECQLGQWLYADAVTRYGTQPCFAELEVSHQGLHDLGSKLVAQHQDHPHGQAMSLLPDLHALRDVVQNQIDALIRLSQPG